MHTAKRRKVMSTHTLTVFHYSAVDGKFVKRQTERELHSNEVLICTTHSGLCYTDVHAKNTGCGLGHEGVGIIEAVGEDVTDKKVGDRVGWGWLHSSCGSCLFCMDGYRQYCKEASGFAFSDKDQGAFSTGRIIDAEYCYLIPTGISSAIAAPMMCAGASTYEALKVAGVMAGSNVGVVGLGGLGHMACLMAKQMDANCVSVIFTRAPTPEKIRAARKLGHRAIDASGPYPFECSDESSGIQLQDLGKPDTLIICGNELPDWKNILPVLTRRSTIVLMSIVAGVDLRIPYMDFILPGHRVIASTECRKDRFAEMLSFVDGSGMQPWLEEFEMTEKGLEEAFGKLEKGKMRFRGVLKVPEGGI